ncbi:site-specific integrase [Sphingomonas sp. RT2P30]|uniref:tyrosine-type recombinase/integrase n=1 Tax=Parasphingomonas halimpatiens TaxID=3096162 RepID=UPI002FC87DC6
MPTVHLTDVSVKSLKPSEKYVTYFSDITPGFGIRVGKRSRTWIVMRGRERERVRLGSYPELSLADARKKAMQILGADKAPPKPKQKTFKEARDQFLEEYFRDKSPRWKSQMTSHLMRHFKALEHHKLDEIEDYDIKSCLDALHRTPSEQLHAFRGLRCFMRWCVRPPQRFIKHSPMEGYPPPGKDRKGTRFLTDHELKAVWQAADTYPNNVLRLIILWGTRRGETSVIERSWVIDDVLTIPGSATKNGRDHAIPLLPIAKALLDGMPAQERYFLRSRWGDTHLSVEGLSKAQREVKERSGTSGWTIHDLRRTFRSNMARLRVSRDTCEVLINHAPKVLDEIYDRYDRLDEKRDALALYEAFLSRLTGANPVPASPAAGPSPSFAIHRMYEPSGWKPVAPLPRSTTVSIWPPRALSSSQTFVVHKQEASETAGTNHISNEPG